jgi:hypothetical protein
VHHICTLQCADPDRQRESPDTRETMPGAGTRASDGGIQRVESLIRDDAHHHLSIDPTC